MSNFIKIPSQVPATQKIEWAVNTLSKFCVLPWLNLNTNPDGKIKLCCSINLDTFVSDVNAVPYNLGRHDIEDIWNSIYMRYVRERTRHDIPVSDCSGCYNIEKLSGHSPRKGQNDMWIFKKSTDDALATDIGLSLDRQYIADQTLTRLPISLELRLGNQCNLQCCSCWAMSSSLIHAERTNYLSNESMTTPKLIWLKSKWEAERKQVEQTDVSEWFETDMFYSNFKKMAPTLRRLYTTGGEPTLIKSNYKMFEMLLAANNITCGIEFTSNMTAWNPSFYQNLEKFKNVEIQMSIDGIDKIGEYIRYPSNFEKVKENVTRAVELASVRPGWKIKCYTVLQALNFKHIEPIWELLNGLARKYDQHIDWWPITLSAPEFLSLAAVKKDIRMAYIDELSVIGEKYRPYSELFTINIDTFSAYKDSIVNATFNPLYHEQLLSYMEFNDAQRSLPGAELFKDVLQ